MSATIPTYIQSHTSSILVLVGLDCSCLLSAASQRRWPSSVHVAEPPRKSLSRSSPGFGVPATPIQHPAGSKCIHIVTGRCACWQYTSYEVEVPQYPSRRANRRVESWDRFLGSTIHHQPGPSFQLVAAPNPADSDAETMSEVIVCETGTGTASDSMWVTSTHDASDLEFAIGFAAYIALGTFDLTGLERPWSTSYTSKNFPDALRIRDNLQAKPIYTWVSSYRILRNWLCRIYRMPEFCSGR